MPTTTHSTSRSKFSCGFVAALVALGFWATALYSQDAPAAGQTPAAGPTTLVEIQITGSSRYQPAELTAATGLKVGQTADVEALKAAGDRLSSTGLFSEITYSYGPSPGGTRVEYHVHDVERLYPAQFDNYVWSSREELLRALQQRRPLFRGEVPSAGEMYTELADDLKAILAEKHVDATVVAHPLEEQMGGEISSFVYQVEGVHIPIRAVEFPGANPEMVAVLSRTAASKLGSDYAESKLRVFARLDLLPQYLQRGFLHARFQQPEFSLADVPSNSVVVRLPVQEGLCYSLQAVDWAGNAVLSPQELSKALAMTTGKPANQIEMEEKLGSIGKIYQTRGYLETNLKPVPTFDDAARTVSFRIEVTEGDQYRLGSVRLANLPEPLAAKLRPAWKLRAGDVFDSSYFGQFLQTIAKENDISRMKVEQRLFLHKDTRTVDVVVGFTLR